MSNQRLRIVLVGAGGYGRLYVETMTQRDYGADLDGHLRYRPSSCRPYTHHPGTEYPGLP